MHPHFLESRLQSTFKSNYFAPANKVLCDKGALRVKQTLGKNTWKGCVQQPFDPSLMTGAKQVILNQNEKKRFLQLLWVKHPLGLLWFV